MGRSGCSRRLLLSRSIRLRAEGDALPFRFQLGENVIFNLCGNALHRRMIEQIQQAQLHAEDFIDACAQMGAEKPAATEKKEMCGPSYVLQAKQFPENGCYSALDDCRRRSKILISKQI